MKFLIPYDAVLNHLILGNLAEAEQWVACLGRTDSHFPESRAAWYESLARLALWKQDFSALDEAMIGLKDAGEGLQRPAWQRKIRSLRVRHALLKFATEDPDHLQHPAGCAIVQRIQGKLERHEIFDRALLRADYRLAALRYSMGLQPVDDLHYTRSQISSTGPCTPKMHDKEIQRRGDATRRSLQSAYLAARGLDRCFESYWREQDVQKRERRFQEMLWWVPGETSEQ